MALESRSSQEPVYPGRYQTRMDDGRFRCDLCPRHCKLRPGQRAFCYVRVGTEEGVGLATYGRSTGFCIDPIEKKPLHHYLPGTAWCARTQPIEMTRDARRLQGGCRAVFRPTIAGKGTLPSLG